MRAACFCDAFAFHATVDVFVRHASVIRQGTEFQASPWCVVVGSMRSFCCNCGVGPELDSQAACLKVATGQTVAAALLLLTAFSGHILRRPEMSSVWIEGVGGECSALEAER